jgi:hypothetical protein
VITCLWVAILAFDETVNIVTAPYWVHGDDPDEPVWSRVLQAIAKEGTYAFGLYLVFVVMRARAHLRFRYSIPNTTDCACSGSEDFFYSFFCRILVVAQMARHINDYDQYSADCCSETGLAADAEDLV